MVWLKQQTEKRSFEAPIVEFGSLQPPGQEGYSDIRRLFPGEEFIGCDMFNGPGVNLIDDIERSHFGSESVGTVICLEILEHVELPWQAVGEMYRILKPGGLLIVSVPFRMPIHNYPGDYWRMTAKGLAALLQSAGFIDIEVSDSGEELEWDLTWDRPEENVTRVPYPYSSFAVAKKVADTRKKAIIRTEPDSGIPAMNRISLHEVVEQKKLRRNLSRSRETVDIVVPVFHREDDTRLMFNQLRKVTDNYSLIIVNNGFDNPGFLKKLNPQYYIENGMNTGAIRPINQGLDVAQSKYIAILHNDLLIFDDGWLDHIVEFMERRPDVGLVGMAGRHSINEDGSLDLDTTVVNIRGYPYSHKPTWRLTEVVTIDGLGWVMRNVGLRLDESFGLMHFYDLDLSLQYIEAGYRVYVASVEITHLAQDEERSTRSHFDYLNKIGGDDKAYYDEVREKFRKKWQHMLPMTRGYQDEACAYHMIDELHEELDRVRKYMNDIEPYVRHVEEEDRKKAVELENAARHVATIEGLIRTKTAECEKLTDSIRELEKGLSGKGVNACDSEDKAEQSAVSYPSALAKLRFYVRNEGLAATCKRTTRYIYRRASKDGRRKSREGLW